MNGRRAVVIAMSIAALVGGGVPAAGQSPGVASSPDASGARSASPPDGTWRVDLTSHDLEAAGATPAGNGAGVYTWTFGGGRASIDVQYGEDVSVSCAADIDASGEVLLLVYDRDECSGEVDAISWALKDDGLHLTLLATTASFEDNRAYLEAKPWQPVGTPAGSPSVVPAQPSSSGG